jgi:NADH:ubiquinone oxidoreductase subunit 5 (subunit L)/multisubunit Na+/H+ antiporter MnhA subunit
VAWARQGHIYKFIFSLNYMKKRSLLEILNKDNHYLDFWSIVHFFTGFLLGVIFKSLKIYFKISLLISFILLTFWEIVEPSGYEKLLKTKFKEKLGNQITDVIFGIIGFLLYWFLV